MDTIVLVELFEVYNLLKTFCLLIELFHREKRILSKFIYPKIEVAHFQILGIIPSCTVF